MSLIHPKKIHYVNCPNTINIPNIKGLKILNCIDCPNLINIPLI